ncbi:hypothetical protein CC78DRAFT_573938 [Lojkania enalia]|uniref:Uncharacterized protein n=1 Tax=Lojkania enalia TaxID=147567 RepID=A0A9P4NCD7_9PLEO|nr:hypothetical protein CC78DRAFT_573938 [Didymosphaeria enalia]
MEPTQDCQRWWWWCSEGADQRAASTGSGSDSEGAAGVAPTVAAWWTTVNTQKDGREQRAWCQAGLNVNGQGDGEDDGAGDEAQAARRRWVPYSAWRAEAGSPLGLVYQNRMGSPGQ